MQQLSESGVGANSDELSQDAAAELFAGGPKDLRRPVVFAWSAAPASDCHIEARHQSRLGSGQRSFKPSIPTAPSSCWKVPFSHGKQVLPCLSDVILEDRRVFDLQLQKHVGLIVV